MYHQGFRGRGRGRPQGHAGAPQRFSDKNFEDEFLRAKQQLVPHALAFSSLPLDVSSGALESSGACSAIAARASVVAHTPRYAWWERKERREMTSVTRAVSPAVPLPLVIVPGSARLAEATTVHSATYNSGRRPLGDQQRTKAVTREKDRGATAERQAELSLQHNITFLTRKTDCRPCRCRSCPRATLTPHARLAPPLGQ